MPTEQNEPKIPKTDRGLSDENSEAAKRWGSILARKLVKAKIDLAKRFTTIWSVVTLFYAGSTVTIIIFNGFQHNGFYLTDTAFGYALAAMVAPPAILQLIHRLLNKDG